MALYFCLVLLALGIYFAEFDPRCTAGGWLRKRSAPPSIQRQVGFARPKPPWVGREVLRLKALQPHLGCRKIADTFNHLHGSTRKETVGKTFVSDQLRGKEDEIRVLRNKIKHKKPRPFPKHFIWAADLTFAPLTANALPILGLVDHGTRVCLLLEHLQTRTSIAILRHLLDTIERHGKPRALRTDNEAVFTSRLFRWGLAILRIKHQRIHPFAPWQNGKIERLFLTLKAPLGQWWRESGIPADRNTLARDLAQLRCWYNHLRPHQHLNGLTPAMVWNRKKTVRGRARFVSAWNGLLGGFLYPT